MDCSVLNFLVFFFFKSNLYNQVTKQVPAENQFEVNRKKAQVDDEEEKIKKFKNLADRNRMTMNRINAIKDSTTNSIEINKVKSNKLSESSVMSNTQKKL